MNTLMKRNSNGNMPATPFSGIVDKLFQNNLSRFFDDDLWGFTGLERKTAIPVNIRETDKSFELELIAPGYKKEDFKVSIDGETLTVSLEYVEENNEQNKKDGWLRKEYKQQSFTHSFGTEDLIDTGKITAKYNDGILHLTLPKKEGVQNLSQNIEIQ